MKTVSGKDNDRAIENDDGDSDHNDDDNYRQ